MHRTLKEDTTKPPALTLRLQHKKFEDIYRVYFRDAELGELDVAELRFRPVRALP